MQASPWWPALVATIDHALARGHHLDTLLTGAGAHDPGLDVDETQALTWRLSLLTGPLPHDDSAAPPPEDDTLDVDTDRDWLPPTGATLEAPAPGHEPDAAIGAAAPVDVDAMLAAAALARTAMGVLPPSDAEIEQAVAHAAEWDHAPFTPARAAQINAMAADYYAGLLEAGWAGDYLRDRLRTDTTPAGAGYAPPGWTHLVDHLHRRGVNDDELLAVGLASTARTGRLIDRFRDRLVLPIHDGDTVLGFVARRHPDAGDDHGPKYLNTPATPLFHKGDVLYGWNQQALDNGAVPVLVEGPLDALAVTSAAGGRYLGVAPLGTSLTQTQARLLAGAHHSPIVAFDADPGGQVAAERAYWLLTQHATTPLSIALPPGADPASLLRERGPESLAATLNGAHALAQDLLDARATHLPTHELPATAAAVIAADHPDYWRARTHHLAARCGVDVDELFADVAVAAKRWATEPAAESARRIGVAAVRSGTPSHSPVCEAHRAPPVPVGTSPKADGTRLQTADEPGQTRRRRTPAGLGAEWNPALTLAPDREPQRVLLCGLVSQPADQHVRDESCLRLSRPPSRQQAPPSALRTLTLRFGGSESSPARPSPASMGTSGRSRSVAGTTRRATPARGGWSSGSNPSSPTPGARRGPDGGNEELSSVQRDRLAVFFVARRAGPEGVSSLSGLPSVPITWAACKSHDCASAP